MVRALVLFVLLLTPTLAFADEQVAGLGGGVWAMSQTITATVACLQREEGSSECALFPAGDSAEHQFRATIITASAAGRCCFVGDSALRISGRLRVFDGASAGSGNCWEFQTAGIDWQSRPERSVMIASGTAGIEVGLCSTKLTTSQRDPVGIYAPCDADADCAAISAGTCYGIANAPAITKEMRDYAGVIANCVCNGASCEFTARKEKVRR